MACEYIYIYEPRAAVGSFIMQCYKNVLYNRYNQKAEKQKKCYQAEKMLDNRKKIHNILYDMTQEQIRFFVPGI